MPGFVALLEDEIIRLRAEVERLKTENKELSDKFFASIVEEQMSKVIEKQIGIMPEMDKIIADLQADVERLTLKPHERVIDTRRVAEFLETFYATDPDRWAWNEYESEWEKFKKELGIE